MSCILARYIVTRTSSRIGTNQLAPRRMLISTRNVDLQLKPFIFTPPSGLGALVVRPSSAVERGPQSGLGQKRERGARGPSYTRALSNTRAKTPSGVVKKPWGCRALTLCILRRRNQEVSAPRSTGRRPSLRVSYGNDNIRYGPYLDCL